MVFYGVINAKLSLEYPPPGTSRSFVDSMACVVAGLHQHPRDESVRPRICRGRRIASNWVEVVEQALLNGLVELEEHGHHR